MAKTEDLRDVGLAVVLLRALCNWSQAELSRQSGVDKSLISDYELGKKRPSARTRKRLAESAGVEAAFFAQLIPHARSLRLSYEKALRREPGVEAVEDAAGTGPSLEVKIAAAVLEGMSPYLFQLEQYERSVFSGPDFISPLSADDDWPET
jgi:transcriptional regulator with XRE-family HTH domain